MDIFIQFSEKCLNDHFGIANVKVVVATCKR